MHISQINIWIVPKQLQETGVHFLLGAGARWQGHPKLFIELKTIKIDNR